VYANDELELHEVIGDQDSTFERIENRDFLERVLINSAMLRKNLSA